MPHSFDPSRKPDFPQPPDLPAMEAAATGTPARQRLWPRPHVLSKGSGRLESFPFDDEGDDGLWQACIPYR